MNVRDHTMLCEYELLAAAKQILRSAGYYIPSESHYRVDGRERITFHCPHREGTRVDVIGEGDTHLGAAVDLLAYVGKMCGWHALGEP